MSKRPYQSRRAGSKNLYYKRLVPENLRAPGRPSQIWRSLETDDALAAKEAYRRIDAEIDSLFADWWGELKGELAEAPSSDTVPLTAALARRVLDKWRAQLVEEDFKRRGDLWKAVEADPQEVSRMQYRIPKDWPYDPFDVMREDGIL